MIPLLYLAILSFTPPTFSQGTIGSFYAVGHDTTRPFFLPPYRDPLWGKDKAYHFSASFFICTALLTMSRTDEPRAFAVTVGIGVLKEFYDWGVKRTGFSLRDLAYDILSAASACAFRKPIFEY